MVIFLAEDDFADSPSSDGRLLRGVRLRLNLTNFSAVVLCFMDHICFIETHVDVTNIEFNVAFNIAGSMVMKIDCSGFHRLFSCKIGWQFLVFYLY